MILSELTDYLAKHRRATLADMAHRLGSSAEALRSMLELLARKGRVRRIAGGACFTGCSKCDQASVEIYEWIAPSERPQGPSTPAT